MRNALLVIGSNQYGVVSEFFNGMREDLATLGIHTHLLDVASEETIQQSERSLEPLDHYDFVVTFNAVGLDIKIGEQTLTDYAQSHPLYVFLVDHPIHLIQRFVGVKATILCIDEEHVSFCQLCGFQANYFPHAVSAKSLEGRTLIPLSEKTDEVIFPVSYFDEASALEKLKPVWHQISNLVEQSTTVTRFLQLLGVLPLGNRPATIALDENIRRIALLVDKYLRARERSATLEHTQKYGIKLTLLGNGVERYQTRFSFHDFQGKADLVELKNRIHRAKFVLHNSPGFEMGLHERVVLPLSLGTLVIAQSHYIRQKIPSGVVTIEASQQLDEQAYAEQQQAGFETIKQNHTWLNRFTTLLQL